MPEPMTARNFATILAVWAFCLCFVFSYAGVKIGDAMTAYIETQLEKSK